MRIKLLLPLAASAAISVYAYDTPTMGWSSWNTYRVNISDSLIMKQADALVELGLDSVGYRYINIDDGYFGGRDKSSGRLLFHPTRFPSGLKPVVDHIHLSRPESRNIQRCRRQHLRQLLGQRHDSPWCGIAWA